MALFTVFWGLDSIILSSIAFICAYVYMTRKFLYWKKRGIMEISPSPFIGNYGDCLLLKKSPGDLTKEIYDRSENQNYVGFYYFDQPFLMVRDPELVKNILVRDFNYFSDRYTSTGPDDTLGKANLFIVKNPAWKIIRTKLTPIFTTGKLKKMFQLMIDVGTDLETHLNSLDLEGQGGIMEIKELCAKYATDIIGTTAFGLQVNCVNNPDAEFRKQGRQIFTYNLWRTMEFTSLFVAPQLAKPMGFKFFTNKCSRFLRNVFWDTMRVREQSGEKRNDLIDLLIELKNSDANAVDSKIIEFNADNLVAQAAIFFTGGFETSSTTLSFAMYELALSPDVQSRAREEIVEAMANHGGKISYEMITSVPYLDMVLFETLRKYPVLPFLDRVANVDYKIPNSDFVIEKGIPVHIPVLGFHYDPKYFPDPDTFDPERFTAENKKTRPSCVYLPFGEGPHMCIGMRFAQLQMKLCLVHILTRYELTACKKTQIPVRLNPRALMTNSDGEIYLNFRKISPSIATQD